MFREWRRNEDGVGVFCGINVVWAGLIKSGFMGESFPIWLLFWLDMMWLSDHLSDDPPLLKDVRKFI